MKAKWVTGPLWIVVSLVACCAPKPDGPITAAFDGIYKGNGYSVSPPGWDCPNVQPADTLTVSGGYATIADLRLAELQCASEILGFKEVITFGYRDSGMMNSPDNADPRCSWQAPLDELTGRVVDVIRRVKPQVMITFDPFGGYGHPDHIKCNRATLAAFEQLKGDPDCPQKLYYAAFPRLLVRIGVNLMRLRGQDPRKAGVNGDLDFQEVLDATLPIHTKVNVADYYEIGQRAAACHASQQSPRQSMAGFDLIMRYIATFTGFTRVVPPPAADQPFEIDLFTGVTA